MLRGALHKPCTTKCTSLGGKKGDQKRKIRHFPIYVPDAGPVDTSCVYPLCEDGSGGRSDEQVVQIKLPLGI